VKHSEFMTLEAFGLNTSAANEQFLVVIEYPDKTCTSANLVQNDCKVRQVIEVRQNVAWSEPAPILVYIGVDVQRGGIVTSTDEVRVVARGRAFIVVSNIRKCYIRPF